jgi:hypothetical protein
MIGAGKSLRDSSPSTDKGREPFMLHEARAELTVVTHAAFAFVLAWAIGYERFYSSASSG